MNEHSQQAISHLLAAVKAEQNITVQRSFSKGRGNFPNLFTECESEKVVQTEPVLYTIFTTGFSVEEKVACCEIVKVFLFFFKV